jgi:hypothetical protein
MKKQKNKVVQNKIVQKKIIEDKKLRGEWAESVFMARATEHGLPVSKPWGEMSSYDFVIGKTGRFVSVQVKSTLSKEKTGYECAVRGGHQAYPAGAFDFLAAYVVPEDVWYIIPAKFFQGQECVTLFPNSPKAKYEPYREAWNLLREAAELKEEAGEVLKEEAVEGIKDKGDEVQEEEAVEVQNDTAGEVEAPPPEFPRNAFERMQATARFVRKHWGL